VSNRALSQCVTLLALLTVVLPASAQNFAQQVQREVEKKQKTLNSIPDSDAGWKDMKPNVAFFLGNAGAALAAGQNYLALEQLGKASSIFDAKEYADKYYTPQSGMEGYEVQWKRVSAEVTSFDGSARNRQWAKFPVIVRALSESASGKVDTVLHAGQAYAKVTSPETGFFYLGQTKALADFANFCYRLDAARRGSPFPLRSIKPELRALQARMFEAFQPPRSIDKHPLFITMSATLKTAFDLDASGLFAGALYQYLDAVRQLTSMEMPDLDAAAKTQLESGLSKAKEQLYSNGLDDSIADLWVQKVQSLVIAKNGKEPQPDEWKAANAIIKDLVPAYFNVVNTVPKEQPSLKRSTTITLVRWPYT